MKTILLGGKNPKKIKTLVDDEDYIELSKYSWCLNGNNAVKRVTSRKDAGGRKFILMHRQIMKAKKGQMIDHIDRNPLNNQKSNLRFCTYQENNLNTTLRKDNMSGHKNVYWDKKYEKWVVQVQRNKRKYFIGRYANKQSAIQSRRAFTEQMVAS